MNRIFMFLIGLILLLLLIGVCTRTAAESPALTQQPALPLIPAQPVQPPPPAAPPPNLLKLPTRKEAMAMKLKASQSILEGIALNDFDKVSNAAKDMIMVSNLVDFLNAFKGKEYAFHVEIMRRPAEQIMQKAKDKNMDGVMLGFNDLTLSCLKCHQAMRDNRFEIGTGEPMR